MEAMELGDQHPAAMCLLFSSSPRFQRARAAAVKTQKYPIPHLMLARVFLDHQLRPLRSSALLLRAMFPRIAQLLSDSNFLKEHCLRDATSPIPPLFTLQHGDANVSSVLTRKRERNKSMQNMEGKLAGLNSGYARAPCRSCAFPAKRAEKQLGTTDAREGAGRTQGEREARMTLRFLPTFPQPPPALSAREPVRAPASSNPHLPSVTQMFPPPARVVQPKGRGACLGCHPAESAWSKKQPRQPRGRHLPTAQCAPSSALCTSEKERKGKRNMGWL